MGARLWRKTSKIGGWALLGAFLALWWAVAAAAARPGSALPQLPPIALETPTATATDTATPTATATATETPTATPTATVTETATTTATATATSDATATATATTTATTTTTATVTTTATTTTTSTATATATPTTTSTATATATATATVTVTPTKDPVLLLPIVFTPFRPTPGIDDFANGSFEKGPGVEWVESSTQGLGLIVTQADLPSGITPRTGSWLAWLGGRHNEISLIEQRVTVPAARPYLRYWRWIVSEDFCGRDFGGVIIDGGPIVDAYTLCTSSNTNGWQARTVDLRSFVGQSIRVRIRAETDSQRTSSLFIDDVEFVTGP